MRQPTRILVMPGGSEIGLEIFHALRHVKNIELWGGSSLDVDHGSFAFERFVPNLPFVDQDGFVESIERICVEHQIDFIFPAHDSVVVTLARAAQEGQLSAQVITSPASTCDLCRSKRATYAFFAGKLAMPRSFADISAVTSWPVFLKPDVGQGSRGTHLAHNAEQAEFHRRQDPSLLMLEYLPGEEFTIDCLTDRHGTLRFVGARERLTISNGISVYTRPVPNGEFMPLAETINQALPFRGMWFFQARRNAAGTPHLLEISPRVAGSMALYRSLGVNLPLLALHDAQDEDLEICLQEHGLELDRTLGNRYRHSLTYDHVYIDLDDTLIVHDRVNTQLIAFIFQCINRGIQIHLLTRHARDLEARLAQFRLQQLFDTVQHLVLGQPKSDHIQHARSIFIDDSHRERMDVAQKHGIPVFGPDAVESLLDARG